MVQSVSDGNAHLERLHHRRKLTQAAAAAIARAAAQQAAEHYDRSRVPGPSDQPGRPPAAMDTADPAPAE